MADFVQNTTVKSAIRTLSSPIEDVTVFNTIVQSVISTNPFGCVAYMTAGETHTPVEKSKESYVARIVYRDSNAKTTGYASDKYATIDGFTAGIAAVLANTAQATAHAGTAVRDTENETYSVTLKCHDPNGELYYITISRAQVSLTSYSSDEIKTKVETWADSVPELA
ncbi:MAG: hypothetical protein WC342_03575 [Methanoregula sp.]|jgi:hypothetical protein